MTEPNNQIQVGAITLISSTESLKELIAQVKTIIQDDIFSKYLHNLEMEEQIKGASYAG